MIIDFAESNIINSQIKLFDISGKELFASYTNNKNKVIEFDLNGLNSGLYLINISFGNSSLFKKLVVEK